MRVSSKKYKVFFISGALSVTVLGALTLVAQITYADLVDDPSEDKSGVVLPSRSSAPNHGGLIQDEKPNQPRSQGLRSKQSEPAVSPGPQMGPASSQSQSAQAPNKGSTDSPTRQSVDSKRPGSERGRNADAPIYFESEDLSGDRLGGTMILEKKVIVTQDDLRITADKAVLTVDKLTNEVTEVVATGNVKFSKKDPELGKTVTADSKEAVFNNSTRTVVLKGDPKMVRGTDVIRGRQIIYDLTTGWVKATRVEGVVQPSKADSKKTSAKPVPQTEGVSDDN